MNWLKKKTFVIITTVKHTLCVIVKLFIIFRNTKKRKYISTPFLNRLVRYGKDIYKVCQFNNNNNT